MKAKKSRFFFLLMTSFTLIAVLFSTGLQFFKGYVIDDLLDGKPVSVIMKSLSILGAMIGFEIMFTALSDYSDKRFSYEIEKELRSRVTSKTLNTKVGIFLEKGYSYYVNELTNKVDLVVQQYYQRLTTMFWLIFRITFVVIALISVDVVLSILVMFLMLFPLLVPKMLSKRLKKHQRNMVDGDNRFLKYSNNYLSNFETIKLFSVERLFFRKFNNEIERSSQARLKNNNTQTTSQMLAMVFSYYTYFITLGYTIFLIYRNQLPIGLLITILGLVEQLSWPILSIANVFRDVQTTDSIKKELLSEIPSNVDYEKGEPSDNIISFKEAPAVVLEDVSFSYDKDRKILDKFNCRFEANKKYLIFGESGRGKTTLLNLILKYYEPNEGKIYLSFESSTAEDDYRYFSVVRQDEALFFDSLRFNLTLGQGASEEEIKQTLKALKLEHFCEGNLESENQTDKPPLSGGELRRFLLGRALLSNKPIIILDEPLAGLDNETAKQIEDVICSIQGKTVIVVSHLFSEEKRNVFESVIAL